MKGWGAGTSSGVPSWERDVRQGRLVVAAWNVAGGGGGSKNKRIIGICDHNQSCICSLGFHEPLPAFECVRLHTCALPLWLRCLSGSEDEHSVGALSMAAAPFRRARWKDHPSV